MTDLALTADENLGTPETPARQLRLVTTDLAPTADIPSSVRTQPDLSPAYAPCSACGALVLTGMTSTGAQLTLDVRVATYTIDWQHGSPQPLMHESRGYPLHQCVTK